MDLVIKFKCSKQITIENKNINKPCFNNIIVLLIFNIVKNCKRLVIINYSKSFIFLNIFLNNTKS